MASPWLQRKKSMQHRLVDMAWFIQNEKHSSVAREPALYEYSAFE